MIAAVRLDSRVTCEVIGSVEAWLLRLGRRRSNYMRRSSCCVYMAVVSNVGAGRSQETRVRVVKRKRAVF